MICLLKLDLLGHRDNTATVWRLLYHRPASNDTAVDPALLLLLRISLKVNEKVVLVVHTGIIM